MIKHPVSPKAIFIIGFYLASSSVFAQKTDTVYLLNGDRITGEFKKYEYGILTFKTDAMQTISIEFDRINTVYTDKYLEIRLSSGYRYYGTLVKSGSPTTFDIVTTNDTIPKPILEVVQITKIKNSFFQRIDGSVDLGLNYTKASDVLQYNVDATVTHRSQKYSTRFELGSIFTEQDIEGTTRENDVSLAVNRLLPNRWFAGIQARVQQNTELNLDRRIQGGAGAGYDLVYTNSNRLYTVAGLMANAERTLDSAVLTNNLEALFSLQYKWFQYRHPEIDVTSSINYYPSLTVKNRHRMEYDLKAKIEIVIDLYFSITFYDNLDSKPSEYEPLKNDWGIITSIGYTF
jgi:hypothetical protein